MLYPYFRAWLIVSNRTQVQLADELGFALTHVSKMLIGERPMTQPFRRRIREVYGPDVEKLLDVKPAKRATADTREAARILSTVVPTATSKRRAS